MRKTWCLELEFYEKGDTTNKSLQEKKVEFSSILIFNECKARRLMEKDKFVAPEKMDPHYSSRGLS